MCALNAWWTRFFRWRRRPPRRCAQEAALCGASSPVVMRLMMRDLIFRTRFAWYANVCTPYAIFRLCDASRLWTPGTCWGNNFTHRLFDVGYLQIRTQTQQTGAISMQILLVCKVGCVQLKLLVRDLNILISSIMYTTVRACDLLETSWWCWLCEVKRHFPSSG